MDFLVTAVAFVLIFSLLVLIHEFGHFFVARRAGIKVEEFGFGLPPRIWGKKKGETLYSINAIPFGGFVRLLGEDGGDGKLLKDKRSFYSKSVRVRAMVIGAGVFMNFMLAWVLLTVGFTIGMQPLILDGDDVLSGLDSGVIQSRQGVVIKSVKAGGSASMAGLQEGDRITAMNGKEPFSAAEIGAILDSGKPLTLNIVRDGSAYTSNVGTVEGESLGITVHDVIYLPRVAVHEVERGSSAEEAGVKGGDIVLAVNGKAVYFVEDYMAAIGRHPEVELTLDGGVDLKTVQYELPSKELVLISAIYADTPAERAGLKKGDIIKSMDGEVLLTPEAIVAFTRGRADTAIGYEIERDGETMRLEVTPEASGLIGVGLSRIFSYKNDVISVYGTDAAASVVKISDVSYPFWLAPFKALEESGRLAVLTAQMFVDVIRSLITKLAVPEGVAGVVGIAQLTHVFVREGAMPLLRFVALLSMSLAMINIFPIPALDGGKMLFIVAEAVTGRKINRRFEAVVHLIGFALLMLLIVAITFSDIARIFAG